MGTQLRAAAVTFDGKPTTCMMTSEAGTANYQGRLWGETEYCFDNASGLLVVSSLASGMFTTYSYSKSLALDGHTFPDHFTMYVGGNQVLDASLTVSGQATASVACPGHREPRRAVPYRGSAPMNSDWYRSRPNNSNSCISM